MNRFALYTLAESITPPFIFRFLRNNSLCKSILRSVKKVVQPVPCKEVTIQNGTLQNHTLLVNPAGSWQKQMIEGTYDEKLFAYIEKHFSLQGKTIYDIGGHIGYHSLVFSKLVGDDGSVSVFEPNPANATRIRDILALNPTLEKNIHVFECALSDHSGVTNFLSTENIEGGTSSGGFIDEATPIWEKSTYTDKIGFKVSEVTINTIDELVEAKKITPPDLLKVDVEGAEHLVLQGAQKTINKFSPIIFVELHSILASYETTTFLLEHKYAMQVVEKEEDGRVMLLATPAK